jgi:hypothetical protein
VLFHVGLVGFYVGLDAPLSLDSFQGRSHMDKECLACTGVPDRNLQFRTFAILSLEMVVLEGRVGLLNTVFLRDMGYRRAFA